LSDKIKISLPNRFISSLNIVHIVLCFWLPLRYLCARVAKRWSLPPSLFVLWMSTRTFNRAKGSSPVKRGEWRMEKDGGENLEMWISRAKP
jgi:hypothetical protein